MKFKNKVVAAVSATVITAGMVMSSVPAFAGSEEMDFINSYNGTEREIAQYVIGEGCTIEEATEIMDIYLKGEAELEGNNSGISTYAEGDTSTEELSSYYNNTKLAATQHYVLVIAVEPKLSERNLNFYFKGFNNQILEPVEDSCRACFSYSESISMNTFLSYPYNDNYEWQYQISVPSTPSISDETTAQALITLPINPVGISLASEAMLYRNINFSFNSQTDRGLFTYETYALGDVNHDGSVTNADSTLLLRYLNKIEPDLKLDYKDGSNHYSAVTNFVAADFDKNNKVNLADVIYINKNLEK